MQGMQIPFHDRVTISHISSTPAKPLYLYLLRHLNSKPHSGILALQMWALRQHSARLTLNHKHPVLFQCTGISAPPKGQE